jgi:hypothetical protein
MDDPNLLGVCRATKCSAIDLRADVMSACQADSDCVLRMGTGCCESCSGADPSTIVAVSQSGYAELKSNACRPDDGPCSKCAVQYPPGYEAKCDPSTKHCRVATGIFDAGTGG